MLQAGLGEAAVSAAARLFVCVSSSCVCVYVCVFGVFRFLLLLGPISDVHTILWRADSRDIPARSLANIASYAS